MTNNQYTYNQQPMGQMMPSMRNRTLKDEGKTDDIDKVKSMKAIKMKYNKQQDGNNE